MIPATVMLLALALGVGLIVSQSVHIYRTWKSERERARLLDEVERTWK